MSFETLSGKPNRNYIVAISWAVVYHAKNYYYIYMYIYIFFLYFVIEYNFVFLYLFIVYTFIRINTIST